MKYNQSGKVIVYISIAFFFYKKLKQSQFFLVFPNNTTNEFY